MKSEYDSPVNTRHSGSMWAIIVMYAVCWLIFFLWLALCILFWLKLNWLCILFDMVFKDMWKTQCLRRFFWISERYIVGQLVTISKRKSCLSWHWEKGSVPWGCTYLGCWPTTLLLHTVEPITKENKSWNWTLTVLILARVQPSSAACTKINFLWYTSWTSWLFAKKNKKISFEICFTIIEDND